MTGKVKISAASLIGSLLAVSLMVGGCGSKDTSGFRAEQKPSKDAITKQIAEIKANQKIPPPIKEKALQQLEQDLAKAK